MTNFALNHILRPLPVERRPETPADESTNAVRGQVRLILRGFTVNPLQAAGLAAYGALTGIGVFLGLLLGS